MGNNSFPFPNIVVIGYRYINKNYNTLVPLIPVKYSILLYHHNKYRCIILNAAILLVSVCVFYVAHHLRYEAKMSATAALSIVLLYSISNMRVRLQDSSESYVPAVLTVNNISISRTGITD